MASSKAKDFVVLGFRANLALIYTSTRSLNSVMYPASASSSRLLSGNFSVQGIDLSATGALECLMRSRGFRTAGRDVSSVRCEVSPPANSGMRMVPDESVFVIERVGKHLKTLGSGYREVVHSNINSNINRFSTCAVSPVPAQLSGRAALTSLYPNSVRGLSFQSAPRLQQQAQDETKGLSRQAEEDPFDSLTDKIPERPVTVAEGASYSLVILAGLAVAAAAAYAVFKELVFEPKEYKIFGKALERVQHDHQVMVRLGSPITGYGQESRNRAARQRISHKTYVDEDGVERVEVMFYIRGPQGAGKVYSEMFKDNEDKNWKYTYLIVDITAPTSTRLMLESYMPAMPVPIRA